ncbi:hypothetical protein BGX27_006606 [Mortierella sp. AM989]|nr:hypothetical protein BGX27_006606 [Mortierella sp. AM989]
MARLRSLIKYSRDEKTAYDRREWIVPLIQLFHLQMALSGLIIKNYFGSTSKPGSIAFNVSMLGRNRINIKKQDFHTADELIRHTFDSIVLRAHEVLHDFDILNAEAPHLDHCSRIKQLSSISKRIVDKYYVNFEEFQEKSDVDSSHVALFLRDAGLYIELSSAIKAGDIGRIEEILLWLTIMFQAGGTKNYGYELLRLHCNLRYGWTDKMKKTVMTS